jgi:hypothetical protein
MYRCKQCDKKVESGEPANKVVTCIRKVRYSTYRTTGEKYPHFIKNAFGQEIVQEQLFCKECKDSRTKRTEVSPDFKQIDIFI